MQVGQLVRTVNKTSTPVTIDPTLWADFGRKLFHVLLPPFSPPNNGTRKFSQTLPAGTNFIARWFYALSKTMKMSQVTVAKVAALARVMLMIKSPPTDPYWKASKWNRRDENARNAKRVVNATNRLILFPMESMYHSHHLHPIQRLFLLFIIMTFPPFHSSFCSGETPVSDEKWTFLPPCWRHPLPGELNYVVSVVTERAG